MAAMLSSLSFLLTLNVFLVFLLYYPVYSFVDFNKSSLQKKRSKSAMESSQILPGRPNGGMVIIFIDSLWFCYIY